MSTKKMNIAGQFSPVLVWLTVIVLNSTVGSIKANDLLITPTEYLQLRSHVCNGTELSGELATRFANPNELLKLKQIWFKDQGAWADHCLREPSAWRWNYVHELEHFGVYIRDQSIDQRLANGIYTTTTAKIFDIDIYRYNSGSRQEDEHNQRLVAGPQVDDELCGRHLEQMLALIGELGALNEQRRRAGGLNGHSDFLDSKYLRLARVLDSFGRYDSGHLLGRTMTPGAYGQCLRGELQLAEDNHLVKTRYCWARLRLDKHLDETLRLRNRTAFETQKTSLLSGVCLPESCHSKSFQQNRLLLQELVNSQFRLPKSMYIDETLELESLFCLVDERSQFGMPLGGKLLLVGLLLWTLTAIYLTNRRSNNSGGPQGWLEPFDLNKSWKKFLHQREQPSGVVATGDFPQRFVQLDALNMIKCLLCINVVVGHSLLVTNGYSMDELHHLNNMESDVFLHGLFACTMFVDTFFVITGILLAFSTLRALAKLYSNQESKQREAGGSFNWPTFMYQWLMFTINRYLRIVPLLALVYWFKRWVWIYLGWGPFWDFGFNKTTKHGACVREHWLVPFTFWSAYLPMSRQCLLQSWSISNDLFFSIFTPPILLLLYKRPRTATLLSVLACLASLVAGFLTIGALPTQVSWEMQDLKSYGMLRLYNIASHLYTSPHLRSPSLLIGVLAGYHLYYFNEKAAKQSNGSSPGPRWPAWFTGPATLGASCFLTFVLVGTFLSPYLKFYLSPYHRMICAHLLVTIRLLWVMSNAILFVRLTTSWKESRFGQMSSSKFWKIASQLNYAILLVHLDLLLFNAQITSSTQVFSTWSFIWAAASSYLLCFPIGLYLHIFIENPLEKFIRFALLGRETTDTTKSTTAKRQHQKQN